MATKDTKEYEKAKVLLYSADLKVTEGYITKWANVAVSCEDLTLRKFAESIIRMYKMRPQFQGRKWGHSSYSSPVEVYGGSFQTIHEWVPLCNALRVDATRYVDECLNQRKPAWQIMAESQGWTPPRNM